jgi:hypothetical protein
MMPGLNAWRRNDLGAGETEGTCSACGGAQVAGTIGFPLLGAPRFGYKLRATEVSVEVTARMCESCGLVEFWAKDPKPIKDARAALLRAEEAGH